MWHRTVKNNISTKTLCHDGGGSLNSIIWWTSYTIDPKNPQKQAPNSSKVTNHNEYCPNIPSHFQSYFSNVHNTLSNSSFTKKARNKTNSSKEPS